jgi:hypothetical protein
MEFEDYYEFQAVFNYVSDALMRASYRYTTGEIDKVELLKFLAKLEAVIKEFELEPPPLKNKDQRQAYKSSLNGLKKAVKNIKKNIT